MDSQRPTHRWSGASGLLLMLLDQMRLVLVLVLLLLLLVMVRGCSALDLTTRRRWWWRRVGQRPRAGLLLSPGPDVDGELAPGVPRLVVRPRKRRRAVEVGRRHDRRLLRLATVTHGTHVLRTRDTGYLHLLPPSWGNERLLNIVGSKPSEHWVTVGHFEQDTAPMRLQDTFLVLINVTKLAGRHRPLADHTQTTATSISRIFHVKAEIDRCCSCRTQPKYTTCRVVSFRDVYESFFRWNACSGAPLHGRKTHTRVFYLHTCILVCATVLQTTRRRKKRHAGTLAECAANIYENYYAEEADANEEVRLAQRKSTFTVLLLPGSRAVAERV